jgi:glycosyltransferase involved in cell wall biosynthesis
MTAASGAGDRVLIEGHNLTFAAGTGIATYARQLASALRGLGYRTELLAGSNRGIDRKDPLLAQISLFDADPAPRFERMIQQEFQRLTMGPFAVKSIKMPPLDAVVGGAAQRFADFGDIHVVPHLQMRENQYFRRYRRKLEIDTGPPPDLFHATRPAPLQVKGCPNIYTLHDIVPLRLPFTTRDDKKLYLNTIRDICRTADHIVTVSEFSRRDIIAFTGITEDRITNTYQAVSLPSRLVERSTAAVASELDAMFGLTYGGYFLFVGALEPKKNISRLIDAYAASGSQRPLIIAGSDGWMNEGEVLKIASERFLTYQIDGQTIRPVRSVRRISYLPFEQLVSLMRGARALLFPSIYEGFGLPVLESMLLGTPVMTSNVSSLPEVAGEAALLVDPYDVDAMADGIRQLDADSDLCDALAAAGKVRAEEFSPARYSQRLSALYKTLI